MTIGTQDGIFTVSTGEENRGDYDGDGKLTALDALAALQMAVGKRAEDLIMDVNDDGKVTSLDAREILIMAVSEPQGENTQSSKIITVRTLSADQQRVVDMFGWPHSFTLLEIEIKEGEYRCSETWTYYDGQTRYYFIDGEYHDWEPVESLPEGSISTPYRPDEFVLGSNKATVKQAIASGDEWLLTQEAGFLFEGILDEAEIYAAPQLIAGFHQDRLILLEAVALIPEENE